MNGIGEVMGELGHGVAIAGAGEPDHGGRDDGHTHEADCLNCGVRLVGSHCHACGQAAHVHRTLGAFFHDLLHGVFHFEGKIWRTLPLLVWHPGRLTREYIDGRRASYVSPIALFLFFVFMMFAVFHATEGHGDAARHDGKVSAASIRRMEGEIAGVEAQRKAAEAKGEQTSQYDLQIAIRRETLNSLRNSQGAEVDVRGDADRKVSDIAVIDKAVKKFRSNPELATYKLQTYAYKYSWALIPISIPFMWLLFPFSRRFHLYDHTVFVTYSLCFMTLLIIVAMVAGAIGLGGFAALLVLAAPPVHMYRQLRGAYVLSRGGALWRTAFLLVFSAVALGMFCAVLMAQTSM